MLRPSCLRLSLGPEVTARQRLSRYDQPSRNDWKRPDNVCCFLADFGPIIPKRVINLQSILGPENLMAGARCKTKRASLILAGYSTQRSKSPSPFPEGNLLTRYVRERSS